MIGVHPPIESAWPSSRQRWVRLSSVSSRFVPVFYGMNNMLNPHRECKDKTSLPNTQCGESGPMGFKLNTCTSLHLSRSLLGVGKLYYSTNVHFAMTGPARLLPFRSSSRPPARQRLPTLPPREHPHPSPSPTIAPSSPPSACAGLGLIPRKLKMA
jgi:hypothetical protein